MKQPEMNREMIAFGNLMPDSPITGINAMWDQSAKVFASVMAHPDQYADDREMKSDKIAVADHKVKQDNSSLKKKTKTPLTKRELVSLQEKHAMWLK